MAAPSTVGHFGMHITPVSLSSLSAGESKGGRLQRILCANSQGQLTAMVAFREARNAVTHTATSTRQFGLQIPILVDL